MNKPFIIYDDTSDSKKRLLKKFKNETIGQIFMEGRHHNFLFQLEKQKQKVILMPGKKYCDQCDGTGVQDIDVCKGCDGKGMISCDANIERVEKSSPLSK